MYNIVLYNCKLLRMLRYFWLHNMIVNVREYVYSKMRSMSESK